MKKSLHEMYGADSIRALSMGMRDHAETTPIPERFMVKNGPRSNCVVILDTTTGRHVEVALCHYVGVREVLNAFFGD